MSLVMAERVTLGERIALLRRMRRLTQEQLGQVIGSSGQTISNWERGVAHPSTSDLPALSDALGIDIAGLFNEDFRQSSSGGDTTHSPRSTGHGRLKGDDTASLFNAARPDDLRESGVKPLPIYRWGSLGDPRDRESSPHPDREEYPPAGKERLIGPNVFGVDVRGESMVGRDVQDGDVCWVNPDRSYRLGDLVLALVTSEDGDSGMVIKTYARTEVGDCLVSDTATGKSPMVCQQFSIVGPVIGVQRWFPPR